MSQLLNEMDGIESLVNVIVIAATNKPDLIVSSSSTGAKAILNSLF